MSSTEVSVGVKRSTPKGKRVTVTVEYGWRDGSRTYGLSAQAVGERLAKLEAKAGRVTPKAITADAADSRSPYHDYFVWDDAQAGPLYREEQARWLVRALVTVTPNDKSGEPTRAFVHVTDGESAYMGITKVLANDKLRQQVLDAALAELNAVRRKYRHLQELADVWSAIDKAL